MKTLRSYADGKWHQADSDFRPLVDPSTEETIAQVSSRGVDFAAVLEHARERGGPALRNLTFEERAARLKATSKLLREHRDELLDLSRRNTGTTRGDGAFDVDGATGTLAYYAALGKHLGESHALADGDGVQLGRSEGFWGRHLKAPRRGAAVHVNAFNFPAWGFAEKAACALLAGVPVITKPATATAWVAARTVELAIEAEIWPEGALQLVCGSTGDLLDRLGWQDLLAFTGSAETARYLCDRPNFLESNLRINVEADSLNAAVVAPGVAVGSPTFELFLSDVLREITQKAGQKCTAVRRILVPRQAIDRVSRALAARLGEVVTGNPADETVTMGPLASAQQLDDAISGTAELAAVAEKVFGTGERADGVGSPAGKGFFFPPVLLRADDARAAEAVHRREVFGPVATLLPYDGSAREAAEIVALAGGTLVTSAYGDDREWLGAFVEEAAHSTGRIYLGSEGAVGAALGSGAALPQCMHGGPGRAGGGEELGGLRGLEPYFQRLALQGDRAIVDGLIGD